MNYFIDDDLHRLRISITFNFLFHASLEMICFRSPAFSNHISWATNKTDPCTMYTVYILSVYNICTMYNVQYALVDRVLRCISLSPSFHYYWFLFSVVWKSGKMGTQLHAPFSIAFSFFFFFLNLSIIHENVYYSILSHNLLNAERWTLLTGHSA